MRGQTRSLKRLEDIKVLPQSQLDSLILERSKWVEKMNKKWSDFDVLICPPYHHSAFKHSTHYIMNGLLDYQCVWSVF